MSASLVGSEMCIRDSRRPPSPQPEPQHGPRGTGDRRLAGPDLGRPPRGCLLYTSDAADDM
eukprot:2174064-Alexandrium_andersonii.AAC.1